MWEPGKDGKVPLRTGIKVKIKTALKFTTTMPEKDFTRPWGGFIKFIDNKPCTVKVLQIKQNESLSLQSHELRNEFWYIISGKIKVYLGKDVEGLKSKVLSEEEHIFIPKNTLHRAEGLMFPVSKILEISTGEFREDDIIRYKDKYGRA